ncbi:phosphoglycolate phosphatase [Frigidibacter sp. MR17.24]|uniref:phosphoglycolate phosphatase n=1 Tax=Frigidibacter sp. MR17.24 TaxID=3127345 RepID=UPI0030130B10
MRIVFDLDGTLIDSVPQIHAITNAVLAENGVGPLPMEQVKSFVGNGLPALLGQVCEVTALDPTPARIEAMRARFEDLYASDFNGLTVYPDVMDVLSQLRAAGHALGLCTNKPNGPTLATLRHLGLDSLFDCVIGGDSLPVRKPDPAPLHAALDALGSTGRMAYVGDSEVDADCAAAAGVDFLFFTEGYLRREKQSLKIRAEFSRFGDLPALIAALAAGDESR